MPKLTPDQKALIFETVLNNPYIKSKPTKRQLEAISNDNKELFFGGAAGGGKSEYLLMCALQYVQDSNYSALLLRKTFSDLAKPGALIPRSFEWLGGTDAKWNGSEKRWTFPSGAVIIFGHLEHENDKYNYQGGEYNFIGFDELPHFTETQYRYLFSRLRKVQASTIPSRIRSTGNPDGPYLEWVKSRFVDPGHEDRPFIPSKLEDNPHLNIEDYEASLDLLDPITRAKLRFGDWTARPEGTFFRILEIEIVDEHPTHETQIIDIVRSWDLAATEEPGADDSSDPDYTVGLKLAFIEGFLYILNVTRGRWSPGNVDKVLRQTAQMDGRRVRQIIEEEPGSSGKRNTHHIQTQVLREFSVEGVRATGDKVTRAVPAASWVNQGKIRMIRGNWNEAFLSELAFFPNGAHDDQVDAFSGAFNAIMSVSHSADYMTIEGIGATQNEEIF